MPGMKKHMKKMKKNKAQKPKAKKAAHATSAIHKGPLTPLGDRVIVKPLTAEEMGSVTASGIIIPDSSKEKPERGTVIAVGPGKFENGVRTPMGVTVGDKVMFSKYGFDEIKIDGVTYYVIAEANVLAILN
jgi:chaperonin GroES